MTDFDSRILAGALAASLALLFCDGVFAVPMRCSGEQTTCIASCKKNPDRSYLSICITDCGARQSICMRTGCWDNGVQKYCGLQKQWPPLTSLELVMPVALRCDTSASSPLPAFTNC